jgi:N-acetylglucosamine kinase-like BadF-type ATPase
MSIVAGIDAGQSSTRCVLIDANGNVLGRGSAGPAAHVDQPPGSRTCADACAAATHRALEAANLPQGTIIAAVYIGLSGYDERFDGAPPARDGSVVTLAHDAPIALAGAIQARPACVVIAGTGSVVYGEDAGGAHVRAGGWGFLFGDEGSAYAVARDALAAAMRACDRGVVTPLGDAATGFFDRLTLRDVATHATLGRIPREQIASFARVVHDAARLGDADAAAIVAQAADALAVLTAAAITQLELPAETERVPVVLVGGAFANDAFSQAVRERLAVRAPLAEVTAARYEPAIGAALRAFASIGLPAPERIVEA